MAFFSGTYPLIYSDCWSFYMRIYYMQAYFWSPYFLHITRFTCNLCFCFLVCPRYSLQVVDKKKSHRYNYLCLTPCYHDSKYYCVTKPCLLFIMVWKFIVHLNTIGPIEQLLNQIITWHLLKNTIQSKFLHQDMFSHCTKKAL